MHKIDDIFVKLNKIVYGLDNIPEMERLAVNITGVRDSEKNLHMVFVSDSDCDFSKGFHTINKVYETIMNDELFRQSVLSFEDIEDIDFMTLISFVYYKENIISNSDGQIKLVFMISRILATM